MSNRNQEPLLPLAQLEYAIALALVGVNPEAGRATRDDDPAGVDDITLTTRARRLVRDGYVLAGDPYDWAGGYAPVATILMEFMGGGKCTPPLDYYHGGIEQGMRVSDLLGDCYIEQVNPGVALVWPRRATT